MREGPFPCVFALLGDRNQAKDGKKIKQTAENQPRVSEMTPVTSSPIKTSKHTLQNWRASERREFCLSGAQAGLCFTCADC